MAEFRLGRLKFVWKGAWAAATEFIKDDVVRYGGKAYVCTATHTSSSNFYTDTVKWDLMADGIQLNLKSQLLYSGQHFYLNGERIEGLPDLIDACLLKLADARLLLAADLREAPQELIDFMYDSFLSGYLIF